MVVIRNCKRKGRNHLGESPPCCTKKNEMENCVHRTIYVSKYTTALQNLSCGSVFGSEKHEASQSSESQRLSHDTDHNTPSHSQ